MVGYDVPHVSHDMILRFMGMNFSAITEGSAKIPSSLGSEIKPVPVLVDAGPTPTPPPGKSKEQNKAMWEGEYILYSHFVSGYSRIDSTAYYNAGSAALVLVIIAVLIAGFVWWRSRKGKLSGVGLPLTRDDVRPDEEIPLTQSNGNVDDHDQDTDEGSRERKGKGRATGLTPKEEIFGVGDDEFDDEESRSPRR